MGIFAMKSRYLRVFSTLTLPMLLVQPAAAQTRGQDTSSSALPAPQIFSDLVGCRTIADAEQRLACYDAKVAALDEAQKNDEVVIADQAAVKEAKRGLFGFNLPKLKILGKEGTTTLDELTAVIKSARQDQRGRWTITLEDGATWQQIDSKSPGRDAKAGMSVTIKKASLGTFFVKVDKQVAMRMKRVN